MQAAVLFTDEILIHTGSELDIVDVTGRIRHSVEMSGIEEGVAHLFIAGQTAALTTIEYESGAVSDLRNALKRLAPDELEYEHNARWGDGNGRSHIRAALTGPGLAVPVRGGKLLLGTWQQIVLVELDLKSRERKIWLSVIGTRKIQEKPR
jgi:secondary thiamine-phosphate synthase enzyme